MSKAEKFSERDIEVLKILNEYKWDKKFKCKKCRHKEYTEGRQPFSRRCKNKDCRYDESLLKYTALEGLRFPVEKAYLILCDLLEGSNPNDDEKNIIIERNRKKRKKEDLEVKGIEDMYNEGECISLNELFERHRRGEISWETMDRLCNQCVKERSVTISKLAKKHDLQENTVSKFMDKIAYRVEYDERYHDMTHLEGILDYIHGWGLSKLLGFIMLPLGKGWLRGEKKINRKWYKLWEPFDRNGSFWHIDVLRFSRKNEKGEFIEYYNKPDEPEYLCESYCD